MTPEQEAAALARIARESEERFGKKASKEKFAFRQAERAKLGLGKEKRKRGGLSGVWDRNKQVIKPIAAGVAGALTGGAAIPALLGAAMEGFDRPGKSGLGFDIGRGLRGAGTGALAGAGGAAIGGAANLTPAFGSAATKAAAANVGGGMAGAKGALSNYFMPKPGPVTATETAAPATAAGAPAAATGTPTAATAAPAPAATGVRGMANTALRFAQANPNVIAGVAQGIGGALGAGAQRDAALAEMDFERERWEQQQLARRRMAELLAPEWSEASRRRLMPLATPEMGWTPTDFASLNPNRA